MVLALFFAVLHGVTLAEAIVPAGFVLTLVQVARYVFAKVAHHQPGRLAATAAAVLEAIRIGGRVTVVDHLLVGGFAT
ncbi:hypothetical protein D3C80_2136910 [compost metagenome]